ncbi:uncharacterized protein LOC111273302 [Varroa jacobsoni]|uniref:Uncharacterized protein n=1 Tax=Varroa destructor TaxID=109461 RepID=A0A7M7JEJ4_VARDE|nr:uncharacterized protein LOC111243648 [Varroa destructor]XP_022710736.1 uncharacterized protein LOC111273302 [Varroa jacobsoni]XP_022710737.1 uncharacterized protein LOC111273302 [Varroa jacobsoni]
MLVTALLLALLSLLSQSLAYEPVNGRALYEDMLNKGSLYGDCWTSAIAIVNNSCAIIHPPPDVEAYSTLALYSCFIEKFEKRRIQCGDNKHTIKCPEFQKELRDDLHRQVYTVFLGIRRMFCEHWRVKVIEASSRQTEAPWEGRTYIYDQGDTTQNRTEQISVNKIWMNKCTDPKIWGNLIEVIAELTNEVRKLMMTIYNQVSYGLNLYVEALCMEAWQNIPYSVLKELSKFHDRLIMFCSPVRRCLYILYDVTNNLLEIIALIRKTLRPTIWYCTNYIAIGWRQATELIRISVPLWIQFPQIVRTDVRTCPEKPFNMSMKTIGLIARFESIVAHTWASDLLRIFWNYREAKGDPNRKIDIMLIMLVSASYAFENKVIAYSLKNCANVGETHSQAVQYIKENHRASRALVILLMLTLLLLDIMLRLLGNPDESTCISPGSPIVRESIPTSTTAADDTPAKNTSPPEEN